MKITCKNCGKSFQGNYCNNCGQSADTPDVNSNYVIRETLYVFFNFDRGMLFTVKELFTRPGHSIREFISGKQVKHFKPITFFLIVAVTYGFLYHFFQINFLSNASLSDFHNRTIDLSKLNDWIGTHYSWYSLMSIPLFSISSYFSFRKQGYSFSAHFILNTFLAAQRIMVQLIFFPLVYIYNATPRLSMVQNGILVVELIVMIWGFTQFFHNLAFRKSLFLSLLTLLLFYLNLFIVLLISVFVFSLF